MISRGFSLILFLITVFFSLNSAHASSRVCIKGVCVNVEVVSQTDDMQRGLQGRNGLVKDQGMLFVFQKDDFQSFWMKDMKFPIDMIWFDSQYHIVSIAPSCPACVKDPCEVYTPTQKASYVLEVSSGLALKHQFKVGDVVELKGVEL